MKITSSLSVLCNGQCRPLYRNHWLVMPMPRLLTGNEIYNRVSKHRRTAEEAAAEGVRQIKREERAAAMKEWKEVEAARLKNEECRAAYKEELRL